MLWTIIAIVMVLYSDDIPEVTLDLYWAIISIWIKLIDNLINVPGIQKNLIDAYHASEGYRIYLYQNVYFLGFWLFSVILCYVILCKLSVSTFRSILRKPHTQLCLRLQFCLPVLCNQVRSSACNPFSYTLLDYMISDLLLQNCALKCFFSQ